MKTDVEVETVDTIETVDTMGGNGNGEELVKEWLVKAWNEYVREGGEGEETFAVAFTAGWTLAKKLGMMGKISVAEFEAKVLMIEEIVIRIRAPSGAKVNDYEYQRKAVGNQSITDWMNSRVRPLVGDYEVEVVGANYSSPHGRTKLETLRSGYGAGVNR